MNPDWIDRIERRHDLWRGAETPELHEVEPSGDWMLENDLPALINEVRRLTKALEEVRMMSDRATTPPAVSTEAKALVDITCFVDDTLHEA